ncbi:hypothetical protein BDZ89DRAFT_1151474 [Hymenopellis radicata]|nr:hypothetical protein BDZ89DRAFT_1151474 [Hymenopellis radicata]
MSQNDTDWEDPEDDALWNAQIALFESLSLEPPSVVEPIPGCQPPWRPASGDDNLRTQEDDYSVFSLVGTSSIISIEYTNITDLPFRPDAQRQVSEYSNNLHQGARDWGDAVTQWQNHCKDGTLGRHVCGNLPSASAESTAAIPSRPPPYTPGPSTPLRRPTSTSTPRVSTPLTRPSQAFTPPSARGRGRPVLSTTRGLSPLQYTPRATESTLPTASSSTPAPSPSSGSSSQPSSQPSGSSSQPTALRYFAVYVRGTTIVEIFRNRTEAESYIEDIENAGGSVRLRAATNLDEL